MVEIDRAPAAADLTFPGAIRPARQRTSAMDRGNSPSNLNPEIQTTKFTKHHENQAVPKRFRLIHQASAKMATMASAFMLFVTFVVSHFPV